MELVNFPWERDQAGYEFVNEHHPQTGETIIQQAYTLRVLHGRSGKVEIIRPLDGGHALFVELSQAGRGEDGAIAFANEFGLIYNHAPVTMDEWPMTVVNMSASLRTARNRKRFRDAWNKNAGLARAEFRLGPDLDFRLVPNSLVAAAYLQLALHVARDGQLHTCAYADCGNPFVTGGATHKRKTRKWCSKSCKDKAYRAGKSA